MRKIILSVLFFVHSFAYANECTVTYFTQRDLADPSSLSQHIRQIERNLNNSLKKTFDLANKLDHYTFGLISWLISQTTYSIENLSPEKWNKILFEGVIVYEGTKFSPVPLRGAKISLKHLDKKIDVLSGTQGEFSQPLYKIVPYQRLRVFPFIIVEVGGKKVPYITLPMEVTISSPTCTTKTLMDKYPAEPMIFLLGNKNN